MFIIFLTIKIIVVAQNSPKHCVIVIKSEHSNQYIVSKVSQIILKNSKQVTPSEQKHF